MASNNAPSEASKMPKAWLSLCTNTKYLPGLFTLDYSLKQTGSKYPLVAIYTDDFPADGHAALDRRGIPKRRVDYLLPAKHKDYSNDPRFYDCWTKMTPFSLTEFDRVVMMDSDMLVLKNMDELMDLNLDAPSLGGTGSRVFAAGHACACNPLKKPHYPKDWVPENCAFTTQHGESDRAQTEGASTNAGIGMVNGGLLVLNPSEGAYKQIRTRLADPAYSETYEFADQSLLSDLFRDRWVSLPYVYNALKTLRWKGVHDAIWRDDQVKLIHYILGPKPWDDTPNDPADGTHEWWHRVNQERRAHEAAHGIDDGI